MELSKYVPIQCLQTNYKVSCAAVLRIGPLPILVNMNEIPWVLKSKIEM